MKQAFTQIDLIRKATTSLKNNMPGSRCIVPFKESRRVGHSLASLSVGKHGGHTSIRHTEHTLTPPQLLYSHMDAYIYQLNGFFCSLPPPPKKRITYWDFIGIGSRHEYFLKAYEIKSILMVFLYLACLFQ